MATHILVRVCTIADPNFDIGFVTELPFLIVPVFDGHLARAEAIFRARAHHLCRAIDTLAFRLSSASAVHS
jgi:hypothetical protein